MNKDKRMDKNEAQLGDGVFKKMFLVTLAGMIVSLLTNVVDSIVTGQFLGSKAVAAMGLVAPVISLSNVVTGFLVVGTSQLCARNFGKANLRKVNQIFSTMAVCSFLLCTLVGAAVFFLSPHYLAAAAREADAETLRMSLDYLQGYAFFLLPMSLVPILSSLMALDNDQKRSLVCAWIVLISNVALDLLNVIVFHGGMLGMALATVFSCCLALFWLLLHFRQPGHLLEFTPHDLYLGDLGAVLAYGMAGIMPMLMISLNNLCINLVLLRIDGTDAVAAWFVAGGAGAFCLVFSLIGSVQGTTEIVAGLAYGEEDASGLERVLKNSLSLSCRAYLAMGLILFAFAHPIAGIFLDGSSAGIQQMAATFIRFMTLQYAMTIACYSLTGILAGTGHVRLNYIFSLLRDGIFPSLCVAALGLMLGLPGVYAGLLLSGALSLCLVFLIPGLMNRKFPRRLRDLLILPESFALLPSECFEATVYSMEDVVKASEQAYKFCRDKGERTRTAYSFALFIEEMAGNAVTHGFGEEGGGRVEVKLILKEEKRMIRLKDNGKPFDPLEWLKKNRQKDPSQNLGIRMVVARAKEVQHIRTMEINHLIISL